MIGYGITLKGNKSKYNVLLFYGLQFDFSVFLYINVLNYRYFHTNSSTFFKNKLDGHGRARREAARRRKSEWKVNLGN